MKKLLIGVAIGLLIGGGSGWAASMFLIRLQTSDGVAVSNSNPLPVYIY